MRHKLGELHDSCFAFYQFYDIDYFSHFRFDFIQIIKFLRKKKHPNFEYYLKEQQRDCPISTEQSNDIPVNLADD
jgi:hypothetical protein